MSKKLKILIVLLVIILALFLYLVLTSRPLDGGAGVKANNQANEIKEKLISDYKNNASRILTDYWQLAEGKDIPVEEGEYLKNRLLELKVPADFKELHLNLVMALTKLNNYLENGDEEEKEESEQMVNQSASEYDWLGK
ncbi:MAG: hypothetical protein PHZ04_01800 [Patescibacteria group bacterium]|nr:hypothetical protein [Patescibacteria group bacterium]MDD5554799.1 hypothetical protein [Patescibacteria group bacterium]